MSKLRESRVPVDTSCTGIYEGLEFEDWQDPKDYTLMREVSPAYDEAVKGLVEALEMGAFHHTTCPWHYGKNCLCAHTKVDAALEAYKAATRGEK